MRRSRGRFVWKSRFPDDALHRTEKSCIIGSAAASFRTKDECSEKGEVVFVIVFSAQAETY